MSSIAYIFKVKIRDASQTYNIIFYNIYELINPDLIFNLVSSEINFKFEF